jgi:hypothetical protein
VEPVVEAVDTANEPENEEQQQHSENLSDSSYFILKKYFGF